MKQAIDVFLFVKSAKAESSGHFYFHPDIAPAKMICQPPLMPDGMSSVIYFARDEFDAWMHWSQDEAVSLIIEEIKEIPYQSSWWKRWKRRAKKLLKEIRR